MFIDSSEHRLHPGTLSGSTAEVTGEPAGVLSGTDVADAATIGVRRADLGSLSSCELKDRVVRLVAERNRIEGEYFAALGELTSRNGAQGAAHELRGQTRMNSSQARTESRLG